MNNYRHGFTWRDNPKLEFNWHPLLMTIGLIFLYGNGKININPQSLANEKNKWIILVKCH